LKKWPTLVHDPEGVGNADHPPVSKVSFAQKWASLQPNVMRPWARPIRYPAGHKQRNVFEVNQNASIQRTKADDRSRGTALNRVLT
jgi:hypothetical protein